jgi:hypothetical protein
LFSKHISIYVSLPYYVLLSPFIGARDVANIRLLCALVMLAAANKPLSADIIFMVETAIARPAIANLT